MKKAQSCTWGFLDSQVPETFAANATARLGVKSEVALPRFFVSPASII
jgi:hypothetical protein